MRVSPLFAGLLGATLMTAGIATANAATGVYYDPSNVASPTGKTTGHELYKTIGCPGKQILDAPCPVPKPVDSDGDGVVDEKDKCPGTAAGRKVNSTGCELDEDGDGVVDALDKCPGTPTGRKVNAQGCELDSDGDGVVDGLDKCPGTPPGRKVKADGCEIPAPAPVVVAPPVDSDGDGITDDADKCPTVHAKTADGCPPPLVLHGVNFDNNESVLRLDAYPILDEAIQGLKTWGDVKVEVAGHTDNVGTDEHNMALSQRRADTVRAYLIGKGIAEDRLTAKGYGESQPIGDNETEEGRFKNRRVELSPVR